MNDDQNNVSVAMVVAKVCTGSALYARRGYITYIASNEHCDQQHARYFLAISFRNVHFLLSLTLCMHK